MTLPIDASVRGETAAIVSTDGTRVVVDCTVAAPPGSTLSCVVAGIGTLRIKVSACKRATKDGPYRVEGRFVDLGREQRKALEARARE